VERVKSVSEVEQPPPELTFGRIVRRIPLYIGLALAGLAAVTLLTAVRIHFGIRDISGGWFVFVGYTGVLGWAVVRDARPHWCGWNFGLYSWVC
jgi:hypothetical protein